MAPLYPGSLPPAKPKAALEPATNDQKAGVVSYLAPRAGRGRSRRLRVRGTLRALTSIEFAEAAPHPNPLRASFARLDPAKSGEKQVCHAAPCVACSGVAHPFEIGDQPRSCRAPPEPCLRLRAVGREIHTGKWRKPSEVTHRFLRRQGNHRHLETLADDFSDVANRDAFFGDRVVPRAGLALLQSEPVEARDIGPVCRRPAIASIVRIGRNTLFARQSHR